MVPEQRVHGHDHPRGAEPALGAVALGDPFLEGHMLGHRPCLLAATTSPQGYPPAPPLSGWNPLPEQCSPLLNRRWPVSLYPTLEEVTEEPFSNIIITS